MSLVRANRFGHLRVETGPVSHLAVEKVFFSVLAAKKINKKHALGEDIFHCPISLQLSYKKCNFLCPNFLRFVNLNAI